MKLSKVSLSIAALCGLASTPALALTAAQYNAANAMEIYISGATAQDGGVFEAVKRICVAGSIHQYTHSNQFVYLCTPTAAKLTGLNGRNQLAVFKHSHGGSGNGVAPVNNGAALPFLDLSKIAASCPAAAAATAGTLVSCASVAATSLVTNAVPQIGISDVEPEFFGAAAGTYNNLKAEPLATVIFGMPVTTVAYNALQAAQGLIVGDTNAANVPSLSSAQITSLFTQEGQSWAAVTGAQLADDTVYVARRADSSGTQKTYEGVIVRTLNTSSGGKSCYAGLPQFLSGVPAADNNAANLLCDGSNLVVNNSGSGQVAACLNKHQSGGRGAIGTLTTEAVGNANWKHVRINGLLPNYANVKAGAFTAYGDASLNTRVAPAPDADHAFFLTAFKANFAVTPVLHPAFGDVNTDAGKAGLMTIDAITGTPDGNPFSRTNDAGVVDNCRPARANF